MKVIMCKANAVTSMNASIPIVEYRLNCRLHSYNCNTCITESFVSSCKSGI